MTNSDLTRLINRWVRSQECCPIAGKLEWCRRWLSSSLMQPTQQTGREQAAFIDECVNAEVCAGRGAAEVYLQSWQLFICIQSHLMASKPNPSSLADPCSDEIQSVVRAPKKAAGRHAPLKKNPLKNLGVMLKLNPYAKVGAEARRLLLYPSFSLSPSLSVPYCLCQQHISLISEFC